MPYPLIQVPRPNQRAAIKKIYRAETVLVAGDLGTGKTKVAGDFIANMQWAKRISRTTIICPLEAIGVWEEWFETNTSSFIRFSIYTKDTIPDWSADVIIINYDYLCPRRKKKKPTDRAVAMAKKAGRKPRKRFYIDKRISETIRDWRPDVIVIDEGHKIKKGTARRSKAIHGLGTVARYKIDLTGTPTGNKKILDLWSQFRFLHPELLGEWEDFRREYGRWGGFGGFTFLKARNVKKLFSIINPYIVRMKNTGLPEKIFIPWPVHLPENAKKIYKDMEKEFVAEVSGKKVVASIVLSKMGKLSQIAGGHIMDDKKNRLPVHTAKVEALRGLLETLLENDAKHVVIFARYIWELKEIQKVLREQGWNNIYRVKGRVPSEVMQAYNSEGGAMVCQTTSGSGSNNFQASNYVIFFSTNYSLIDFDQAIGRISRIGQDKTCFYYFLQSVGTIDMRIYRMLQDHKDVAEHYKSLMEGIINDNS